MWILSLVILVVGCALLWALGGSIDKMYRRIGVGVLIALMGATSYIAYGFDVHIWRVLLVSPLMWAATSVGYGIPDSTDKGSPLGRFFYKIFNKNKFLTLFFTRLTCSLLYAGALFPLVFAGGFLYLLTIPIVIANTMLWSVYIEAPSFKNPWNLSTEELLIGAGIGLGSFVACL